MTTVDIGGGLPVNFESDEVAPTFAEYAAILRETVPALFSGEFTVITEFGRSIMAKNGFIIGRVEYTKVTGGRHIAITHAGAQVATRTVFMPELWPIRVSALDPQGRPKTGAKIAQDVAGPCCFAGDIIASRRALPLLEPDDWVLLHDTGAYYFSTPVRLQQPAARGRSRLRAGRRRASASSCCAGRRAWRKWWRRRRCPGRSQPSRLGVRDERAQAVRGRPLQRLRRRRGRGHQIALDVVAAVPAQELELAEFPRLRPRSRSPGCGRGR